MADYIAAKRKRKIPLPWEQKEKYADAAVTLPLPIVSLNFPKSATLTMKSYFDCGGLTAIHTSTQDGRIGVCMMENKMEGRPPLDRCNTHKPRERDSEVVPIDFISDIGLQGPPCYYSSLHDGGLEHIAEHYSDATILLVTRNASTWFRSMSKWGTILHRWKKFCMFHGDLGHGGGRSMKYWSEMYDSHSTEEYWVNFYHAHTQKIREFAMKHLSMTYVEVELENKNMGKILEGYTRVSPSCVMDCHPGPKWVSQHNTTTGRCHPIGQTPPLKDKFLKSPVIEMQKDGDGDDDDDANAEDGEEDEDGDDDTEPVSDEETEE